MFKKLFIFLITLFVFLNCSKNKNNTNKINIDPKLAQGQRQYHLRKCARCHGIKGDGTGYKAVNFPIEKAPRDFRNIDNFKQGFSVKSIASSIKFGIKNDPKSLMPKSPYLTQEEAEQIATYVIYLSTNQIFTKTRK